MEKGVHNSSSWNKKKETSIQAHKKQENFAFKRIIYHKRNIHLFIKNKKSTTIVGDDALGVEGAKKKKTEKQCTRRKKLSYVWNSLEKVLEMHCKIQ